MKTTHLFAALFLAASLTACGEKEAPEATTEAPAGTEAPMPMPPEAGVAGNVEGGAPEAAAMESAGAGVDGHDLYNAKCVSCHGATGEGVGENPKLAGLKVDEIKAKLMDYRAGKQMGAQTAVMAAMAKPLSDEQIEALAGYVGE